MLGGQSWWDVNVGGRVGGGVYQDGGAGVWCCACEVPGLGEMWCD